VGKNDDDENYTHMVVSKGQIIKSRRERRIVDDRYVYICQRVYISQYNNNNYC
jgi:outer membrane protein assembly factor BamB